MTKTLNVGDVVKHVTGGYSKVESIGRYGIKMISCAPSAPGYSNLYTAKQVDEMLAKGEIKVEEEKQPSVQGTIEELIEDCPF